MRTEWSIDDQDAALLRQWVKEHKLASILEFGPGYSTEVMLQEGCWVDSVEDSHLPPPVSHSKFYYVQHPIGLRNGLLRYLDFEYDFGFVDGPSGGSAPLARLIPALICHERCRMMALHDTNRPDEQFIVEMLRKLGRKVVAERKDARGMILLQ